MSAAIRTFVALNPAVDVRALIQQQTEPLRGALGSAIAWVAEPALHLTLRFLGERPVADVDRLVDALRSRASAHGALTLTIGGVGAFPSLSRPRVVWLGVSPNSRLSALYHDVDETARAIGVQDEERHFHPHVTLGRVRQGIDARRIALAEVARTLEFRAEAAFRSVNVMESVLGSGPPRYRTIAAIPLQGNAQED